MTADEAKAIRKRLGLTQAQIARELGLSPKAGRQTVIEWEQDSYPVSGPAALALRYMDRYGLPDEALR